MGRCHDRSRSRRVCMRIFHVTDAYLPRLRGIEMHVHDLARAPALAGDVVDILTMTRSCGAHAVPAASGAVRPPATAGNAGKLRFLFGHRDLGVRGDYDIVHAHCSTISPMSFFAFGTPGVPRLMTVHSL